MGRKTLFSLNKGATNLDEIRGAEKVVRKTYSYMLTEPQRLRNKVARQKR
jgi:hypothetical protein